MDERVIGVTAFKAQCLGLIEDVSQGRTSRVVLTKHDRPVAAIVRLEENPSSLWGAMKGTVVVVPGVDLTEGTGETWDADR